MTESHEIPNICLFCGSRPGKKAAYRDAAERLGPALAKAGLGLVYGAGDLGLMGIAARGAIEAGVPVTGFIPQHLLEREVGNPGLNSLVVTETMHERKKLMFVNSEAVIALPGGPGTLDELIEVLTWRQIGLHHRPVVLISPDGYWEPFLTLIDHLIEEDFVHPSFRAFMQVVETAEEAVEILKDYLDDA